MQISVWNEEAGEYRFYNLPDGKIRIVAKKKARWLAFQDIELHAEGEASPEGSGEIPQGVIVCSVQEAEESSGIDLCDVGLALAGIAFTSALVG